MPNGSRNARSRSRCQRCRDRTYGASSPARSPSPPIPGARSATAWPRSGLRRSDFLAERESRVVAQTLRYRPTSATANHRGGQMVRGFVVSVGLLAVALHAAPVAAADGRLDPAFGSGGKVLTKLGFGSCGGQAVVWQPDGKLVVGGFVGAYPAVGTAFLLARFNPDGSSDTTFG